MSKDHLRAEKGESFPTLTEPILGPNTQSPQKHLTMLIRAYRLQTWLKSRSWMVELLLIVYKALVSSLTVTQNSFS